MDSDNPDADAVRGIAAKAARNAAAKAARGTKIAGDHIADATRAVAKRTAQGAQVVRPHAARAAGIATEQATRAAASTAEQARRRMPRHEPGEPTRPAILDSEEQRGQILIENAADLPSFALLSSQFLLADFVTSREHDEKRWEKMERVLDRQRLALDEVNIGEQGATGVLAEFGSNLPSAEQIAFLVDLYFLDPFAPYTLKSAKATAWLVCGM